METREHAVFVSHISEESLVARKLKDLIEKAFGEEFAFLSSDYESLRGGSDWYPKIVEALKNAKVTISLLSRTSVEARWINFEAGVAIGAGNVVIPVVFRDLDLGEIGHPLSPKQARDLHDERGVEALLGDIAESTEAAQVWSPTATDREDFVLSVKKAEEDLPRTVVEIVPHASHGGFNVLRLGFSLRNAGGTTIRPTRVEVGVPADWLAFGEAPSRSAVLDVEQRDVDGVRYQYRVYKRLSRPFDGRFDKFTPLPERISPGETIELPHTIFEVRAEPPAELAHLPVRYVVFADDQRPFEGTISFQKLTQTSP